jgi:hypothetical protein
MDEKIIYYSIVNMSLPENTQRPSVNEVKKTFNSSFDELNNRFNNLLTTYRSVSGLNEKTNKNITTADKLLRTITLKSGELSSEINKQIGVIDTKSRKIELTESDINLNQNIIQVLYIILIGVAISIIIMIVSLFMKMGSSPTVSTTSTSNSDGSFFDKMSSYFTLNSGPTYKGNLLASDSGYSGNLFKYGGKK